MPDMMLFTSESVSEGHPDKVADQISDAVLDAFLAQDKNSRVACETLVKTGMVVVAGEITSHSGVDIESVIRRTVCQIGYNHSAVGFDGETCAVLSALGKQSTDIAVGVNETENHEQGAGDQGLMFGYATNETDVLMPAPITYAHRLMQRQAELRKNGKLPWLRPDAKSQVTLRYQNSKPVGIEAVVVSTHHSAEVDNATLHEAVREEIIKPILPAEWITHATKIHINPTGRFVVGGPVADCGLTGRKIIVDTYGGMARHGGGAFCIAGSALVNTEKGLLRIDQCQDVGGNGLLVKTDVHPMPAGAWYDNGLKETAILVSADGYQLEATLNHHLRVIDEQGNYVWKTVADIGETDWISIQTKNRLFGNDEIPPFSYEDQAAPVESYPNELTPKYAYLLGVLTGDPTNQKQTHLTASEKAYLTHLGLTDADPGEKIVPYSIFTASAENCAMFLRGLFASAGSICQEGTSRVYLTIFSHSLAEHVQLLLLNFGIICQIQAETTENQDLQEDSVDSRHTRYRVTLKDAASAHVFKTQIGFSSPEKMAFLEKYRPEKLDSGIIPNQKQRLNRLFNKLSATQAEKWPLQPAVTHELTYQEVAELIAIYAEELGHDADFNALQELYFMHHYYSPLEKKISSFAHTYDLNVPFSHTFTANGIVCHNSGKDPSKVDRSAAYACRYIAKNVVAAGLADRCEIQVSYAIGVAEPTSIRVETFGTHKISEDRLVQLIRIHFDLRPRGLINMLNLLRPIYGKTAAYGHFGREEPEFSWERTDKADLLRDAAGL